MGVHSRHCGGPVADAESEVLHRWGVARCHAVDVEVYRAGLTRLISDETAPPSEPHRLIAYIRGRFHRTHPELLEDAIVLANTAEATHARDDAWPHGLADHLIQLLEDIEVHQQREDSVVFPLLPAAGDADVGARVAAMRREHARISGQLDDLRLMTGGFATPAQGCIAWRLLYVLCGKLDAELRQHMALEDEVLFSGELRVFPEESGCAIARLAG